MQADGQVTALATATPFVTGDQPGVLCPQTGSFASWSRRRFLDTAESFVTPWRHEGKRKGGKGLVAHDRLRGQTDGR